MENQQMKEKIVLDFSENHKNIQKMRFCIISSYGNLAYKHNLMYFMLDK